MPSKTVRALLMIALLAAAPAVAATGDGLWLHVRVDEAHGAKVTVNLPLVLFEKAIPLLANGRVHHHLDFDHHHFRHDMEDLRAVWHVVRNGPDMNFVTIEEHGETVRVWKKRGTVFIEIRDRYDDERVDVRLPVAVVDAFLAGERFDLRAAVQALVDRGSGELVEVRDHEDRVRVWVDRVAEAGE